MTSYLSYSQVHTIAIFSDVLKDSSAIVAAGIKEAIFLFEGFHLQASYRKSPHIYLLPSSIHVL